MDELIRQVNSIFEDSPEVEKFLQIPLFRAAALVAQAANAPQQLVSEIADRLWFVWEHSPEWFFDSTLLNQFSDYPTNSLHDELVKRLLAAADTETSAWVQVKIARALNALGQQERGAEKLVAVCTNQKADYETRREAARSLSSLTEKSESILAKVQGLIDNDETPEYVQSSATWALLELGVRGTIFDAYLQRAVDKTIKDTARFGAIQIITRFGDRSPNSIAALDEIAHDAQNSISVRMIATDALMELEEKELALAAYSELTEPSPFIVDIKRNVAQIEADLGRKEKAISILLEIVHTDTICAKRNLSGVAHQLRLLGEKSPAVVEKLRRFALDENNDLKDRIRALRELEEFGDEQWSTPVILAIARRTNDYTAIEYLGWIKHSSPDVVQYLLDVLENTVLLGAVRAKAIYSLGNLGDKAPLIISNLNEIATNESEHETLRADASFALLKLGDIERATGHLLDIAAKEKRSGGLHHEIFRTLWKMFGPEFVTQ